MNCLLVVCTKSQTVRFSEYRCVRHQEIIEEMIQILLYDVRSPSRHEHHGTVLSESNESGARFSCEHHLK